MESRSPIPAGQEDNLHLVRKFGLTRLYHYIVLYSTMARKFNELLYNAVYAEKNDRSLTLNNWIPRKDRAMKLMAYERTWPNVQYDWVSLSYHKNSSSGLVFYKNKNIAHSQPVSPVLTGLLTGL
jgi:hypothetical protein